ncbi:MAG: hypothetical protein KDE55_08865 [Novosphingobium sp.]|nr:hypothetical protein [Novosphingobium sp.]
MTTTRRALVLSDETASHPFLRSLPPHVRHCDDASDEKPPFWRFTRRDWRDFLSTYCAAFVVVSAFFA